MMNSVAILGCPGCGAELVATRLNCDSCGISIEGRFASSPFSRLAADQQEFVKLFVATRGNIRLMEKHLGVSYPTVRARLDAVRRALELPDLAGGAERQGDLRDVLRRLEAGELSVDQAIDSL
jgi:hypothetical protein